MATRLLSLVQLGHCTAKGGVDLFRKALPRLALEQPYFAQQTSLARSARVAREVSSKGRLSLEQHEQRRKLLCASDDCGKQSTCSTHSGEETAKLEATVVAAVAEVDIDTVDPKLKERFQSIVGALNYCVSNTRPDVAYAVGQLCRVVLARPTPELLTCAERVQCYLYRTRQIGLCYVADQKPLAGMSDSNWATKHSTSGWVFRFCTAAVSWGSKKQKSVALSSCEAEIVASSEAAKEGVYLKRLLEGLEMHPGDAVAVSGDNQAAIALAYNPENHDKVKHVERRHFFIREKVEDGLLSVPYVRTVDNIADFFTI